MQIKKTLIYQMGDYSYKNFIALSEEEKKLVWNWRNEESIRRFMYNKDIIPFENHLKFLAGLKERDDIYYWLIEKNDQILGVVNLTSVDFQESRAELGYYMVPDLQKKGTGIEFAYNNFLFAFSAIGVKTLFGGIDKRNTNAIILDSYLGCVLNEEDINNLDKVDYIRWEVKKEDFISTKDGKNDFRQFVRYMKDNKGLIDKVKEYA